MFHALALSGANALAGSTHANRSQRTWNQTYRALEHGHTRNQCDNQSGMSEFPAELRIFGRLFVQMQDQRHRADYNPDADFSRAQVMLLVDEVEDAITRLERASAADRRAFAIYVLFRLRRN